MARDGVCSSYCYAANLLSRTGTKRKRQEAETGVVCVTALTLLSL